MKLAFAFIIECIYNPQSSLLFLQLHRPVSGYHDKIQQQIIKQLHLASTAVGIPTVTSPLTMPTRTNEKIRTKTKEKSKNKKSIKPKQDHQISKKVRTIQKSKTHLLQNQNPDNPKSGISTQGQSYHESRFKTIKTYNLQPHTFTHTTYLAVCK